MTFQKTEVDKMRAADLERLLVIVEGREASTREVLGTLISWMAQSANSPLRRDEAIELLKQLSKAKKA